MIDSTSHVKEDMKKWQAYVKDTSNPEVQCDQVPKLQNRQIFAENRHDWRVNFRPQILPAKLPAIIRNRLISSYFYPFFLHFYEVRLIITWTS